MDSLPAPAPIHILSPQLADQIAAGEVIERPASVLKELLENSLDAAATRIDVELMLGGMDAIRVTDNGHGIRRNELVLAVSRHATSKISRLDDLLQLRSLGFRGEALASICSVSQWEICSRCAGDDAAFAIHHDQAQQLLAMNHGVGTSVWVRKLFFNTPARRKFLRAERTEFRHCDEVFRRMALARFDVGFYLKHNSRQLQRLPTVGDEAGRSRRVSQLCGEAFLRNSLLIDFPHTAMRLWGWISKPNYSRQQTDLQYFYINGRIIRDRVITHALRHAYQAFLGPGRHAAYVLYLELDPASVDVNVHPTKHEVRFREARQIHDFLFRCLREGLQQAVPSADTSPVAVNEAQAIYAVPPMYPAQHPTLGRDDHSEMESFFGRVQAVLLDRFVLSQSPQGTFLIDMNRAQALLSARRWQIAYQSEQIKQRPILIPQRLDLNMQQQQLFTGRQELLSHMGFDLTPLSPGQLLLRAVPVWLQGYDSQKLLFALLDNKVNDETVFDLIKQLLLAQTFDMATLDIKRWLRDLAQQRDELQQCWRELTASELEQWLCRSST